MQKLKEQLENQEFQMRDYMKVIRAKSAHPLGRGMGKAMSAKSLRKSGRDMSMEMSTTSVMSQQLAASTLDTKYEKTQKAKEMKERLRTFTDQKLNSRMRRKNQQQLNKIHQEWNVDVAGHEKRREALKAELAERQEERELQLKRKQEIKREKRIQAIKELKEKNRASYLDKFPPIPKEVKELRELEHREKYLKEAPLHQRLFEDYEEKEKKKLNEVREKLMQLKNNPIDFAVTFR